MALQSGVSAEAISSVYFKINQIAVKRIFLRSQIRRFWLAVPFNPRAFSIDQLCLEPFHYDFLSSWDTVRSALYPPALSPPLHLDQHTLPPGVCKQATPPPSLFRSSISACGCPA